MYQSHVSFRSGRVGRGDDYFAGQETKGPEQWKVTKLVVSERARMGGQVSGLQGFSTLSHSYCLFLKSCSANYKWFLDYL